MRSYCEDGHFHCANGKCILKSWMCNGWDECGDSSDEQNCTVACKTGYSHCSSNSSLCYDFIHGRCNGILDCPGGEDEQACGKLSSWFNFITHESNWEFLFSALTCGNQLPCRTRGGCYRAAQRCDGMNDCPDGSDEDGCDAGLCGPHRDGFLCRNRHCVTASARCDGVKDCGDFSDEETCMKVRIFARLLFIPNLNSFFPCSKCRCLSLLLSFWEVWFADCYSSSLPVVDCGSIIWELPLSSDGPPFAFNSAPSSNYWIYIKEIFIF